MNTKEKNFKRNGFIGLLMIIALFFVMDAMSQSQQTVDEDGYIYEAYSEQVAENIWFLPVYGLVKQGNEKIENATVSLYKANEIVKTFKTGKNGKFEMELDLGAYYTIEVVKDGFITKRIGINTVSQVQYRKMDYVPYAVDISITPNNEFCGVNTDPLDFPFALVSYYHEDRMFVHNEEYTTEMNELKERLLHTSMLKTALANKSRDL